ncbi:MAG: hypothetical protein SGJ27_26825 [Candidatus Melainabacteria bacterium]|nr:hypothetical protein [Candidatus Melainabacteria bacterium]
MTRKQTMALVRHNGTLARKYTRKGGTKAQKKRNSRKARRYLSRANQLMAPLRSQMWLVKIDGRLEAIVVYPKVGFFLPGDEECHHCDRVQEWLKQIHPDENEIPKDDEFRPSPGSLWLVIVECIYQVIKVSDTVETGIFIPGQEPCWLNYHGAEFLRRLDPIVAGS